MEGLFIFSMRGCLSCSMVGNIEEVTETTVDKNGFEEGHIICLVT